MGKFNHLFKISENGENSVKKYISTGNTARIDFVSESCVRVAFYKNENDMLPTFSVNPNNVLSQAGRSRLSTDGFGLYSPKKDLNENTCSFYLPDGIKIELELKNFILKYYKDNSVLFKDRAPLAYNFENEFGAQSCHYISRDKNERIFGLGDKGGELDKTGRSFRIETTDCMGYDAKGKQPVIQGACKIKCVS
ncbi:MAG: hypothetical protein LUG95_04810 [Clostridiales bacterium]|nr:hypothetical protein [Clostridiales bacterium]